MPHAFKFCKPLFVLLCVIITIFCLLIVSVVRFNGSVDIEVFRFLSMNKSLPTVVPQNGTLADHEKAFNGSHHHSIHVHHVVTHHPSMRVDTHNTIPTTPIASASATLISM